MDDGGDVILDERVRRVVKLPELEEADRPDLGQMLSIMFSYRERKFLRGLGCECERKNDLHSIGDEVFFGNPQRRTVLPFAFGVWFRLVEIAQTRRPAGHVL